MVLDPAEHSNSGQIDSTPSWKDVLDLISNAKAQYEAKGDKSKLRRAVRNGEDVANTLKGLVELIPDEYGLGVLRAALSKLFTVYPRRHGPLSTLSTH